MYRCVGDLCQTAMNAIQFVVRVLRAAMHLDYRCEPLHQIRDCGFDFCSGVVNKIARGDVVLANVEGVKSLGEVFCPWQELPVDTAYM